MEDTERIAWSRPHIAWMLQISCLAIRGPTNSVILVTFGCSITSRNVIVCSIIVKCLASLSSSRALGSLLRYGYCDSLMRPTNALVSWSRSTVHQLRTRTPPFIADLLLEQPDDAMTSRRPHLLGKVYPTASGKQALHFTKGCLEP